MEVNSSVEGRRIEEVLQEIKGLLEKEDIPFNEIMELVLLAISLMKQEIYSLLGLEEKLKERQKREKSQSIEDQEEEPISEEALPCVHFVRVGRPAGRKDAVPRMTLKEFFSAEIIPLHKETDWEEKAREVRERILRGEFFVAGLEDFISYLYAYMLYEDVPTSFEELLMRPTPPALNLR
jgi:hypothetical protein